MGTSIINAGGGGRVTLLWTGLVSHLGDIRNTPTLLLLNATKNDNSIIISACYLEGYELKKTAVNRVDKVGRMAELSEFF